MESSCVLVVDDDNEIRETLADILRDEGYRVQTAPNGEEALRHLRAQPPCIMLLDLMMPVMDGWEVVGQMQDHKIEVPYCVVSATADAAPLGSVCALGKPINLKKLLSVVEDHCGSHRMQ